MTVAVLGAGVIGVTTAYYLARRGFEVVVFDEATEPASGATGGNGGQLSYSYADALAGPALLRQIPSILLGRDPAIEVRDLSSPRLLRWGLSVLRECLPARARANSAELLRLALRSRDLLAELTAEVGFEFGHQQVGKLVLVHSPSTFDRLRRGAGLKKAAGCQIELLSAAQAREVEPALEGLTGSYCGAVYGPGDQVGDARRFTTGLSQWLSNSGQVKFRFGTRVADLDVRSGGVQAVSLAGGERVAVDSAVVCLGAGSARLAAARRQGPLIYPVRGYSVTLPRGAATPRASITDLKEKIVFGPLGDRVRIAGYTDFVGDQTTHVARRQQQLLDTARRLAPQAALYDEPRNQAWSGVRPMTPSSRPQVGAGATPGLYFNTGHGALGWTLACATSKDIADAVSPRI
ncbi:MAG: FAD-dependent oxidoreductase [Pseudomonadota bacterium]